MYMCDIFMSKEACRQKICDKRKLRPIWVSVHSAQSNYCALNGKRRTPAIFMRTTTSLMRKSQYLGRSVCTRDTQRHCWFSHAGAHIVILSSMTLQYQ